MSTSPLRLPQPPVPARCRLRLPPAPAVCRLHLPPAPAARLLILISLLCCTVQLSAQTSVWTRQRSGTLAWIHAVFFLNQTRGWAGGSRGTLLTTTNGGKTWEATPPPSEDVIRDIYFLDDQRGWLVCERNIYELKSVDDPRSYLMTTTDGGNHWTRVELRGADVDDRLARALFSRGGRAWAFGEGGAIYTSRDRGANWTRLPVPTRHVLLGGTFVDEDRGWLVGAGATILQTADGGDTWHVSRLAEANNARFTSASFVDNRLGWAVGTGGVIYRTINGGRTWTAQKSGVATDLFDVRFLDAVEGWAVGAEGTVIHTVDGGLHWNAERTGTTHPLERVFLVGRSHGWAVGFGGTIIAFTRIESPQAAR
ncbi:MAG TPA: YCF48-related protein [Pyrinomonadaceae bacterium]|nr:YCF48-related protein [Pyrinomonadaceae bacterium]